MPILPHAIFFHALLMRWSFIFLPLSLLFSFHHSGTSWCTSHLSIGCWFRIAQVIFSKLLLIDTARSTCWKVFLIWPNGVDSNSKFFLERYPMYSATLLFHSLVLLVPFKKVQGPHKMCCKFYTVHSFGYKYNKIKAKGLLLKWLK